MMLESYHFLADIWFWLIGFILILYVVLDGFDLGAGMLFLWTRDEPRRQAIISGLGYTWHANQTWLVVLGGLLFGAFPLAYGVLLSALYIPIGLMLLGLIMRGVSFEFREEAHNKSYWNLAFGGGSLLAGLAQGFILGGVVTGLKMTGDTFVGSVWDWLNPFSILVAVGLVFGYVLLGAAYLILKTERDLQQSCSRTALIAAWLALVAAIIAPLWAWQRQPELGEKWWAWPGFWTTSLPFVLGLVAFVLAHHSLRTKGSEKSPLLFAALFFGFFFVCLAGSLHPYLLLPTTTVYMAAAQPLTLKIMLLVMVPLLPVMLLYNAYQYWVFRGKASEFGYGE